jgi:hypothetical protein
MKAGEDLKKITGIFNTLRELAQNDENKNLQKAFIEASQDAKKLAVITFDRDFEKLAGELQQ